MLNPIEFVIEKGRFEFSEPELQNIDISYFRHYMTSSGVKQFRVFPDERFKLSFWKSFAVTKNLNTPKNWIDLKVLFDIFEACFPRFNITYHGRIEEFGFGELLVKTPIGISNDQVEKLLNSCPCDSLFFRTFLIKCLSTDLRNQIVLQQLQRFKESESDIGAFYFLFPEIKRNPEKINNLLDIIINEKYSNEFLVSVLSGLITIDPSKALNKIESLGKDENRQPILIQSIWRLEDPTYISNFLKTISNFCNSIENKIASLDTFLKLTKIASDSDIDTLIAEIKNLVSIQDEKIVSVYFNSVRWSKIDNFEQVLSILKNVISNKGFTKTYVVRNESNIIPLSRLVQDLIKSKEELLLFLKTYAVESQFPFETSTIDYSLNLFLEEPKWITSRILELLIDDYGMFRHLGFKLLDYLIEKNIETQFEEDEVFKLTTNQQLKLLISLNTPFTGNKLKMFSSAIQLFKTKNQIVAPVLSEILLNRFQNYAPLLDMICHIEIEEDFRTEIISFLEQRQQYHQELETKKKALGEFDSTWKYWTFVELSNKLFNQSINDMEQSGNKGLWGLFRKTILLKGGGYRNEGETDIKYLNQIQTTSTFSYDLFINSEKESYKTYAFFKENWDDKNWKKWLTRF